MQNKKNLYYGVGAVVFVLLVLFLSMGLKSEKKDLLENENDMESVVEEGSVQDEKPVVKKSAPKSSSVSKEPDMSYEQALALYKDDRIQFDNQCQAIPNYVTYKNGSSIMLDNRSASEKRIKAGTTFTIAPYGFKILKLSSTSLPVAWFVDCNSSENVATIIIQK